MRLRKLIGSCCVAALLAILLPQTRIVAQTEKATSGGATADHPGQLVREVVYNEMHDHDSHGYWRYWIQKQGNNQTLIQEQIETPEGPVARVELANGHPLTASAREEEDRRLQRLLASPSEQEQHRKEYAEDEHRIGRILALLPDAFLYERVADEHLSEGDCYHFHFHPNPDYPAHSIESRIFHAMTGDIWISIRNKHLVRLDGKLQQNVDFGYGILGRLYKDGWFRLERTRVGSNHGDGDWKTQRLEIHMSGRAMLFKTIARETSEVRGGFVSVPAGLSLKQAAEMINEPQTANIALPVALPTLHAR